MNRSQRMKPVMRVAESREQEAAKRLGEWVQLLEERKAQLVQLCQYRDEYNQYFQRSGVGGVTAGRLLSLQDFLAQLNAAITQQEQLIVQTEHTCQLKRHEWLQARGKTKTIDKVVERYVREEMQHAAKREQKEIDEFAQRKGGKSGTPGGR
jgi:flagellar FliJ protein